MGRIDYTQLHTLLAAEHSRLHIVGSWPESSPQKEALLQAIRSSIARLSRNDDPAYSFQCMICRSRRRILPGLSKVRLTTATPQELFAA